MSIAQKSMAFVAGIAVTAAIVFSFVATIQVAQAASLTASQVSAIVSLLQSFGADSATIANVQASLNGQPTTPSAPSMSGSCTFTRDLTVGSKGDDVTCLQNALIAGGYSIPAGATGYFGAQTVAAVKAWQAAKGVTPVAGYFGAKSRAAFGSMSGGTTTTPPPATGTGISISGGVQPVNALAPQGAARVPFTRFTLTAGNDGDVVVNSIQVQRTGVGQDAAFAGVTLIDEATGMQVGTAKTFNSNHQTAIGQMMTIARGTSKTFLVAGNMNTSLQNYAGEAPSLSVVGVNTSATVSGSLPIVGASHVNNATLTVGSLTINTSNAYASNANATKEIGTTGYAQTGFRLTAGSAEDIRLKSLTFNQTGSVSSVDLANVAIVVNGTSYPAVLSSDGRYYTATLGSGLVIAKGNQVDVYIKYDVVGSNSSGRTVIFDVDKNTDIFGTGETYGYGISPAIGSVGVPSSRGTITITNGTPYIYSTQTTISGATITTIGKANEVPAQNIAINLPNQPLGGYVVDLKGEAITVASSVFTIASTTGSGTGLLTNLTIVDENGSVVAGPVDAVLASNTTQTATFSDTITYKTGRHVYTLRGKVSSSIGDAGTYAVTTIPSSGWTTVRGETTGNSISLSSNGTFTMNTMTVKAGSLVIGPSSSLTSQNIVTGGQQVELGRMAFDASQSGEDARISSVPVQLTYATGAVSELTSCQLYNGATTLTTGSNTVNPSGASPATATFTLDNPITIAKGSVTTLSVKCNVSGSATANATFSWAPGSTVFDTGFTVTGAVSGTTFDNDQSAPDQVTAGSATAAVFTVKTGSLSATSASAAIAQPSRTWAAGASTGVTVGYIKFRATNEAVNLTKVGLTLANGLYGSASRGNGGSSANGTGDILTAYIYNGATLIGSATFNGSQTATSTFSPVALAQDVDTVLTIKADLASVGVSAAGGIGDLIKIDPLNAEGTGASSGTLVQIGATAGVNGVQLVKSYPTVALGSGACTGNACNGSNQILKVFTVTANASGAVGVNQSKISVATSSAQLFDAKLYVYDQNGQAVSSQGSGSGQVGSTACASGVGCTSTNPTLTFTASSPVQVPAGTTYTFKLLGTVTPTASATNWSVISTVQGDSAVQINLGAAPTYIATSTAFVSTSNFVWSDNATSTAATTDVDWFNGFQVPGLSGTGI